MKLFRFTVLSVAVCALSLLTVGCVREELPDHREQDYGYVQFKLYKAASYSPSVKAMVDKLEYLSDAAKVKVELLRGGQNDTKTISQTLTLDAADKTSAEFGLRSSRLKLLKGEYKLASFTLYDRVDNELYNGYMSGDNMIEVVAGGLTTFDLTANAVERGKVRFYLAKDMSDFNRNPMAKAGPSRQYTFDEIAFISLTVRDASGSGREVSFDKLPVRYREHFADIDIDGNPVESDKESGYRTSSIVCDSLVTLTGGSYNVVSYTTFDTDKTLLETRSFTGGAAASFTVSDNVLSKATVNVSLYEADEYIKDYYALYEIWKALDGEHWSYEGQSYQKGCNWDFNKDVDLWCVQPGVEVHANGRVAKLNIAGFGIRGKVPAAIGQLTELVELSFGSHSETRSMENDPVTKWNASKAEKEAIRLAKAKAYANSLHPAVQMSAPCALALKEKGISIDAVSMYGKMTTGEVAAMAAGGKSLNTGIDMKAGAGSVISDYRLTNGITGFDEAIGNLTKLEYLYIANSPITLKDDEGNDNFPATMANLLSCTDLELYNCPNLTEIPDAICQMPSVVSALIAANGFGRDADGEYDAIDENTAYTSLKKFAAGRSRNVLQILYFNEQNLRKLPMEELRGLTKIGRFDVSYNNIHGIVGPFGEKFSPVEISFDHNRIEGFDGTSTFFRIDDLDSFSANYNCIKEFPNIFTSDIDTYLTSLSLAYNEITGFPSDFKGVNSKTITLSGNKFKAFPKEFAETDSYVEYILMAGCGLSEFPKGCFGGKYSTSMTTIDLTYNNLTELPEDFNAESLPYLNGIDLSFNDFSSFPKGPLNCSGLTVIGLRGQRDANGKRCLREWPTGIYKHVGLRALYLGSNDLRNINDTISNMIYYLDISDNPNITFDASAICSYWRAGRYILFYDRDQDIRNCEAMLE